MASRKGSPELARSDLLWQEDHILLGGHEGLPLKGTA